MFNASSAPCRSADVKIMRIAPLFSLCLLLAGCAPTSITKQEYDRKCQEAVNLHNTLTGFVYYQGSKDGYDYFHFEPFGSMSHSARAKEGEIPLKKRFPFSNDKKVWVVSYPDWSDVTNKVILTGATNTKF
jgi:hypothetical protein